MLEPSVVSNYVTGAVGRHDVRKATDFLRDTASGDYGVQGFWVTMPLLWGSSMDDPAAMMPNEIIAAVPFDRSRSIESGHSNGGIPGKSGEKA
jgi:hypothetical protein